MSYAAAGLAILSMFQGYMGAQANKKGLGMKADEYDLTADEAILTHHFNTDQRNRRTTLLAYQTMQQGMDEAGVMGLSGKKTVENMVSDIGSSGAQIGQGTTHEIVINQHLQNANTQLKLMEDTGQKLDNIQQNAIAVNQMEDWKVKMRVRQLRRAAATTRSGADSAFFAGMIGAMTSGGSTYMTAGGKWSTEEFKLS